MRAISFSSFWLESTLAPRNDELVRDYIRHVGGDPASYRGVLPAHFFPQWAFPLAAKALSGLPYPMTRVVNAGSTITMNANLPANEPLIVRARLESVDEDERRAKMTVRVITGTAKAPDAVTCEMRTYVPLGKTREKNGATKRPTVPVDAKEIAFLELGPDAGRDFAMLTGDVNPIHWVPAAARAAGFYGCILHGFATVARAVEALNRGVFSGNARALHSIDVRFAKPLVLPARVGVYVTHDRGIYVGDAPGGGGYLEGTFT